MTKDEALQMCLEYIETDAHERRHVRWAIKKALAAPVQEQSRSEKLREAGFTRRPKAWSKDEEAEEPTPPAQRQWVGLTNEEIKIIWHDIDGSEGMLIRFARAIEAKLREKNGGAA